MNEEIDAKTRGMLVIVLYHILFINDVAISYIYDTLSELKKTKLYTKSIVYRTKLLEKQMKDYNASINKRISSLMTYLADTNETMSDELQLDFMKLENAVRNHITREKVPNPQLMAKASIAHTFCDAAITSADYAINDQPTNIHYYAMSFRKYKIVGIYNAFLQLNKLIDKENEKIAHYNCDLRNDNDISNGFYIIINKLRNSDFIMDVLRKNSSSINDF